jgi:hypothetical protein
VGTQNHLYAMAGPAAPQGDKEGVPTKTLKR